jgi:hypothetical protein
MHGAYSIAIFGTFAYAWLHPLFRLRARATTTYWHMEDFMLPVVHAGLWKTTGSMWACARHLEYCHVGHACKQT